MAQHINSAIADMEVSLTSAGFQVSLDTLYVPQFGWGHDEEKASADPFMPQYLAALQVLAQMFMVSRVWVHLAAEMQAGKTGVVSTLIRLILNPVNFKKVSIKPKDIFILTGMSDNSWKEQTCERIPNELRANCHHSGGLSKVKEALRYKANREGGLKNLLIVLDESHIASAVDNRPALEVFQTMQELCPLARWAENNIRLLTISATDPALVIAAGHVRDLATVVNLRTSPDYQSVENLKDAGRIHASFDLVDDSSVNRLITFMTTTYGPDAKLYHMIRPRPSKLDAVKEALERLVPGCNVFSWDCKVKGPAGTGSGSERSSVSTASDDINEVLSVEPEVPTFILLKNMFYAAKTLDDSFVGVLHDRVTGKDDTALQSLLGRSCGYGKSNRTHIFTSLQTVQNYLRVWKDMRPTDMMIIPEARAKNLSGAMAGVVAEQNERSAHLFVGPMRAVPVEDGAGVPRPQPRAAPRRVVHGEDAFESVWSEWFTDEKKAMDWWRSREGSFKPQKCKEKDGFKVCSTTKSPCKHRVDEIDRFRSGKKTANMPIPKEVGKCSARRYVAYADEHDPSTARFCVHWIKRIA